MLQDVSEQNDEKNWEVVDKDRKIDVLDVVVVVEVIMVNDFHVELDDDYLFEEKKIWTDENQMMVHFDEVLLLLLLLLV